jgi:predicted site-specific integrase-resolvase
MSRFISIKEFAFLMGVHPKTVYHWVRDGKVKAIKREKNLFVEEPEDLSAISSAPNEIKEEDRIPLVRGKEVAELLGISDRRLRQLAECGKIGCRKIFGARRYSVQDIRDFIAYKAVRDRLPNGDRTVPKSTAKEKRENVMRWVMNRLAEKA